MKGNSQRKDGGTIPKYFIVGLIVLVVVMVVFGIVMDFVFAGDLERQGQFGDQFGSLNSLFSGMAFLGLILTIYFQSRDLQAQARALELQTEALIGQIVEARAQQKELERSARAQQDANILTRKCLIFDREKAELDFFIARMQAPKDLSTNAQNAMDRASNCLDRMKSIEESALGDMGTTLP